MAKLSDYRTCGVYRGPLEDAHRLLNDYDGISGEEVWTDERSEAFRMRISHVFRLTKGKKGDEADKTRQYARELIERAKQIGSGYVEPEREKRPDRKGSQNGDEFVRVGQYDRDNAAFNSQVGDLKDRMGVAEKRISDIPFDELAKYGKGGEYHDDVARLAELAKAIGDDIPGFVKAAKSKPPEAPQIDNDAIARAVADQATPRVTEAVNAGIPGIVNAAIEQREAAARETREAAIAAHPWNANWLKRTSYRFWHGYRPGTR